VILMAGVNDLSMRLLKGDGYDPHLSQDTEAVALRLSHAFSWCPSWIRWAVPPELWKACAHAGSDILGPQRRQYPIWRRRRQQATTILAPCPSCPGAGVPDNLRSVVDQCRARSVRVCC